MRMKKKLSGGSMGIPGGLAVGAVASMAITLGGAAIIAALLASEKIGEGATQSLSMIIQALAAIAGALCSYGITRKMRLQVCLLSGVCYFLILLGMTALLFEGQYGGVWLSGLLILAGSAVVAFFPTNNTRKRTFKKKAYR